MRLRNSAALAVALLLGLTPVIGASQPSVVEPLPPSSFHPVPDRLDALRLPTPEPVVVLDTFEHRPTPTRPPVVVQQPKPVVVTVTPKPSTPKIRNAGSGIRGTATWYCKAGRSICMAKHPDRPGVLDMYAAAGPALRVGKWRNRLVTVCKTGTNACVQVILADWCACMGGRTGRVIDLYWDAFHALDPRATGGIKVTVHW